MTVRIKLRGWGEAEDDRSARDKERAMIEQAQENKVTVELKPHAALKLIHAVGEAWWMVGGPHEKDSRLTLRLEIDGLACDTNPTITLMADGTWSMTTDLCIDNL